MLRSAAAVLTGYAVMALSVVLLIALWFRGRTPVPSAGFMAFSLAYGLEFAVAGGWVAAWMARDKPLAHAAALAAGAGLLAAVSFQLDLGREPLWYQRGSMLAAAAGPVIGGWLWERIFRGDEEGPAPSFNLVPEPALEAGGD